VRPDGTIRHLESLGEVVRDDKGVPIRLLGICLDVTARKEAEKKLRDNEQSYRFLLKGVRDYAIYMLDAEGLVCSWNEGAERLKGYRAEDIIGCHFNVFLTSEARAAGVAEQVLAAALEKGQFEGQTYIVRRDGSSFFASVVLDAIRDEAGELIGFAKLVRDITVQHEAQVALEETREQLAQSQKMAAS
jgi:PAS domain S-box-containing protein